MQSHLANLGTGGSTLRFGRVWTAAMIAQVALTAIAIPVAIEGASQAMRKLSIRAEFPSREYLTARLDLDRPSARKPRPAFEERRARTYGELEQRIAKEPGVVAVTFADRSPGHCREDGPQSVEASSGAGPVFEIGFVTSAVGPGFFEAFDRPIVAGRPFHVGDCESRRREPSSSTKTFARGSRARRERGSPLGARLRYPASPDRSDATGEASSAAADASADKWFEIVGVVRDFGLDPDDQGNEAAVSCFTPRRRTRCLRS